MTVFSDGLLTDPMTQDDLEPTAAARRGAIIEETFSTLVGPSLYRRAELSEARRWGGMAYREYTPDEAREWIDGQGLTGHLTPENRTYNQLELSILARRKQAELKRRYILERAGGGVARGSERLLLSLATSLADPLTVASAFVPVVSQARYAALLKGASGPLGRAGVRATVGALEGTAGAALVEPVVYSAKIEEQADYGLYDSMANIAFGGLFGGGLHTVGGAVIDYRTARRAATVERAATALRERLAEIDRKAGITPETSARLPEGGADPYFDRARALQAELRRAAPIDVNDPKAVSRYVGQDAQTLAQFVKRTGGISDVGGELAARDVTNRRAPGLVRKEAGGAASVDAVRQRVFDEGYFPGKRDYNEISDSELFDALAEDLFVQRRYTGAVEDRLMAVRDGDKFAESLRSWGIDDTMDVGAIAERLREMDDVTRLGEPPASTAEADAEFVAAAAKADQAAPEIREAALRGAVAQDLAGDPVNVEPLFDLDPAIRGRSPEDAVRALDQAPEPVAAEPVEIIEAAETGAVEQQIADLTESLRDLEAELKRDSAELPAEVRAELDDADALITESKSFAEAARMLAACAMRSLK